jgi:hypothetical protein
LFTGIRNASYDALTPANTIDYEFLGDRLSRVLVWL